MQRWPGRRSNIDRRLRTLGVREFLTTQNHKSWSVLDSLLKCEFREDEALRGALSMIRQRYRLYVQRNERAGSNGSRRDLFVGRTGNSSIKGQIAWALTSSIGLFGSSYNPGHKNHDRGLTWSELQVLE